MSTLFISDLHLQPARPELLRAALAFLRDTAAGTEALYILGDLFEAWIGDDDDTPWLQALGDALAQLGSAGTAVYFMHGNRDFLLGADFAARCGMQLLPEAAVIDLYGRRALLLHGDTLCTEDRDYLAFRAQVRNPLWQQSVLAQPLAQRRQLAAALRSESMQAGREKDADIMDVTPAAVLDTMAQHDVDLLIHGHTHRPARHDIVVSGKPAERIVLGDWGQFGWYLRAARGGVLELVKFPLPAA
jgi:UDP-2,3-diacylglucosamine hydrolase